MDSNEIRDRLLLIARDRLRNRPGAYRQFQHTIEKTVHGVAMLCQAHAMPYGWQVGEEMGNQKATRVISEHMLRIVDQWAQSQPLAPAVEPLPGAEPPPISPARADTKDTATPAPMGDIASGSTTPDPERRLSRLRELGGNAIYRRGEWKITGISDLVASEEKEGRKRKSEKTIRADLKEAAENEREAKRANAFSGLGQR